MPYHILIALDSFKGSMNATQASCALKRGLERAFARTHIPLECSIMPMSDGGEGLLESLSYQGDLGFGQESVSVMSPYQQKINATYLLKGQRAIIEMAQSTGLLLTPKEQRRTLYASSYGLGEMIEHAYKKGAREIILGVGGSATNDGGAGCLQALGVEFYGDGGVIQEIITAEKLAQIQRIEALHQLRDVSLEILCDVENVLLGESGATAVYATQKGVQDNDLEVLESNMRHFADMLESCSKQPYRHLASSGAAGGVVFGLRASAGARVSKGVDRILTLLNAKERVSRADLIITGEGRLDKQSGFGKVPMGIAKLARECGKRTIAVCGALGEGSECLREYIDSMFSLVNKPMSLQEAMENGEELLERLGVEIGGLLTLS